MEKESKPIIQATLGDLKEMIEDMFATPTDYPHDKPPKVKRHLVYGLAGLAKLLGVCKSTASKIKSSGILNPAISQHGKVIVIDADLALELMKARHNASYANNPEEVTKKKVLIMTNVRLYTEYPPVYLLYNKNGVALSLFDGDWKKLMNNPNTRRWIIIDEIPGFIQKFASISKLHLGVLGEDDANGG